jgi:hypothetical protein
VAAAISPKKFKRRQSEKKCCSKTSGNDYIILYIHMGKTMKKYEKKYITHCEVENSKSPCKKFDHLLGLSAADD